MRRFFIFLVVVAFLVLASAHVLYSNPDGVSYSQSSTATAIARRPEDLQNNPTATVSLHFYERWADVGPGTYSCHAWISLSVSTSGGASYAKSSEGTAWARAYLSGVGGASARGAYSAYDAATVHTSTGATAIAGIQAGNVVHVTITSCQTFPYSITATYSGGESYRYFGAIVAV